jgi:hypothetical protein
MRFLAALSLVACLSTLAAAQQTSRTVLRVASQRPAGDRVVLTLESGTVVTIPASDIDRELTASVGGAVPERADTVAAAITAFCAKHWRDDPISRGSCQRNQSAASAKIAARSMVGARQLEIRAACARDWPDDYVARNSCEESLLRTRARQGSTR